MAYTPYNKKKAQGSASENLSELKVRLKEKNISGVYLFRGEEEYMKRHYFSEIVKAAGIDSSNLSVLQGADFSPEALYDAVNTAAAIDYSDSFFDDISDGTADTMRVIKVVDPKLKGLSDKQEKLLFSILGDGADDVCIVFYFSCFSDEDDKKFQKGIHKKLCESSLDINICHEAPTSPLLQKWVKKHIEAKKCLVDSASVSYLIEACGCDMSTLIFEIEKLCAYVGNKEGRAVYNEDIDYICIRNTEAKLDDVSRAVFSGNYEKAERALRVLLSERVSEIYIFGAVANKFSELSTVEYYLSCGLSPFEISQKTGIRDFVVKNHVSTIATLTRRYGKKGSVSDKYISILSEYDEKLKSSAVKKGLLLENMIFKMCKAV